MKARIHFTLFALAGLLFPSILIAQWGPVRFDSLNYFTHTIALSSDSTLSIGVETPSLTSFLLRTTNSGNTWDSITVSTPGNDILFQCLDFTDNNNGFAGGSKNGLQCLMYTTDNGSTWSDITPAPTSADAIRAISFVDTNVGFACTHTTLYKTVDGGMSWTTQTPGFDIFDVKFADHDNGYIAGKLFPNAVIYKTTDGGVTWSTVFSVTDNTFLNPAIQKIDVLSSTEVVAMRQYYNVLYRTIDGGASWDTITLASVFNIVDFDFTDALSGHVVSSQSEIFSTSDGGANWILEYAAASGAYGPNVYLNSISFVDDIGFVCGSNGLVKKHDNATTSVHELPLTSDMHLYPNPVRRGEKVKLNIPGNELNIEIFTATGKMVMITSRNHIDSGNLTSGIYYIRNAESGSVKKLVVFD